MTTHGITPRTVALACLVAAVTLWAAAWCALPGPQPAAVTPSPVVVVAPTSTTFVFVTMTPAPTPMRELILSAPTRAPTSAPIPTQAPVPPIPTSTLKPMEQRVERG